MLCVSDGDGGPESRGHHVTRLPALSLGCYCCGSQGGLFPLSLVVFAQFSCSSLLRLTPALLYSNSPSSEPASCPHQVRLGEFTDPSKFTCVIGGGHI